MTGAAADEADEAVAERISLAEGLHHRALGRAFDHSLHTRDRHAHLLVAGNLAADGQEARNAWA